MAGVSEQLLDCPYCGEPISILVDDSVPEQSYVEDCQVCCRPIVFNVSIGFDGSVSVNARNENE